MGGKKGAGAGLPATSTFKKRDATAPPGAMIRRFIFFFPILMNDFLFRLYLLDKANAIDAMAYLDAWSYSSRELVEG
ncbi:hypothetical protein ACOI93_06755 [Corynebacterium striatum]